MRAENVGESGISLVAGRRTISALVVLVISHFCGPKEGEVTWSAKQMCRLSLISDKNCQMAWAVPSRLHKNTTRTHHARTRKCIFVSIKIGSRGFMAGLTLTKA